MGIINRVGQLAVAKVRQRAETVRVRPSSRKGPGAILAYSGIANAQAASFRNQMQWLAKHATVQPLPTLARTPEAMSNRPRVALVFLGAFDSVHRNAIPILEEFRLPATVFAATAFLGRAPGWDMPARDPARHEIGMSVGQLSSLRRNLFEVGSFTATHPRLDQLSSGAIRAELLNSMNDLSAVLARPIRSLAVPYGACNDNVLNVAAELGYEVIVAGKTRNTAHQSRTVVVPSIQGSPDDWISELEHKVHKRYGLRV